MAHEGIFEQFFLQKQKLKQVCLWCGFACICGLLLACETTPRSSAPSLPQSQSIFTTPPDISDLIDTLPKNADQDETLIPIDPIRTDQRTGLTPPHMNGRNIHRLALILPFSSPSERLRTEAFSMMKAAELAIFEHENNNILLLAFDSLGTGDGARGAALAAHRAGADIIIGPILFNPVSVVSETLKPYNLPIIAFSTNQRAAGNGVYLLSFPPESEVRRIVNYARAQGVERFAFLGPDTEYGHRVFVQYLHSISETGGTLTIAETYTGKDIEFMEAPTKRLADYYAEVQAENKIFREQGELHQRAAFEAVILPEGSTALRSLAPLILYHEDGISDVQFLGTSLWYDADIVKEPALRDGIFAAADHQARDGFLQNYSQMFDALPSRLASQAYDAVNFAATIAALAPEFRRDGLEDIHGFYGADGFVRFREGGIPERGLAVYKIQKGEFVVIDPAPRQAVLEEKTTDPS